MEESSLHQFTNPKYCKSCSETLQNDIDQFCQHCGFPLKGSEEEQEKHIYNRGYQQLELQGLRDKVKSAGTTLYVLAGVFLLFGLFYFFINSNSDSASALLITSAVLAIIFLLLGVWSQKKPVAAIVSGLVLYIVIQIINAFDNPVSIVQGIILKILIIGYLIKGLTSAFEAEKIRKQHNI